MKSIETARDYSSVRIESLRRELEPEVSEHEFAVVLGGSFARREASAESDLDFYVVSESRAKPKAHELLPKIEEILTRTLKPPSQGGPFGLVHSSEEMLKNIGGDDDDNRKFTIRILFLTEGEWLSNEAVFLEVRKRLVGRYLQQRIKPHSSEGFS